MVSRLFSFIDRLLITFFRKISMPLARFALFVVFFWFGILKIWGLSPANPLVGELLAATIPFISFEQFMIGLGLYEMVIGILFLIPRWERVAIFLLVPHMIAVTLPLVILSETAWVKPLVPTMEGQYIIKNLAIVALAISIATHLHPRYRS